MEAEEVGMPRHPGCHPERSEGSLYIPQFDIMNEKVKKHYTSCKERSSPWA